MTIEPWQIDAAWICIAFLSGLLAKRVNLPPLIGFLLTGFLINALGWRDGNISELISSMSDIGVMLLLFTIGLKINVRSLIKPEILVTASLHMILSVLTLGGFVFALSFIGISFFANLSFSSSILIGFALSFSSTVFAVKILEEKGELTSFHGKIAIGILVIQDIFAVAFITFSSGKLPSIWVLALPFALWIVQKLLHYLLGRTDHGEMLTIFGFFATFVFGAVMFSLVGLKADLGALVMGILLVNHPKSGELYDRMMSFKDFLLIAFFVNIGLSGSITLNAVFITLALLGFIIFKSGLFFFLLSRYKLRARTALLSSLSLANYSEFGLIVGAVAFKMELINTDILVAFALLMSISFVVASPLNKQSHKIYDLYMPLLKKINKDKFCIDDEPTKLGNATHLVIGLGSISLPCYQYLKKTIGSKVIGVDYNHERIKKLQEQNENVAWGDSTDKVFWENIVKSDIKYVLLAMSDFQSNINSLVEIDTLSNKNFELGVIYTYEDEKLALNSSNIDFMYSARNNVGADFAHEFLHFSNQLPNKLTA